MRQHYVKTTNSFIIYGNKGITRLTVLAIKAGFLSTHSSRKLETAVQSNVKTPAVSVPHIELRTLLTLSSHIERCEAEILSGEGGDRIADRRRYLACTRLRRPQIVQHRRLKRNGVAFGNHQSQTP